MNPTDKQISQQTLVFLLISIGLITFPHINHLPLPLFAFFFVMLLWRSIAVWNIRFMPNNVMIFLLTVFAVVLLMTQQSTVMGRDSGTGLFVVALGLKLLEIKKRRDLYLACFLSFIVASSQFLYQQSILMTLYILFVCCVLFATLIIINSHQPNTSQAIFSGLKIFGQAIPIGLILFIFFPRFEAPRWTFFEEEKRGITGLSDTLEPGSISQLGLSGEMVFRAKFVGAVPPRHERYWRGPVFSYTDGVRWEQTENLRHIRYMDTPKFQGKTYQYSILMEPQDNKWVFALDMPSVFPSELVRNALYQLVNSNKRKERQAYKLISHTQYNTGYITKTEYRNNLQIPGEPSARIMDLVERLGGFDKTEMDYVQSVLYHFKSNNFYYTLLPGLIEENPIETFLFETQKGFCSHYATAFVYLMRVAGIPARVVTGYQGGELNEAGEFLVIRQANAHAWSEVWLEDRGWIRVDPTTAIAPQRIQQDINVDLQMETGNVSFAGYELSSFQRFWKQTKDIWGSIDYNWQHWVINYTRDNQTRFLSMFGIGDIKSMLVHLLIGIAFCLLVLSWFVLKKRPLPIDKELALYLKFCRKLSRSGITKEASETASQFSKRLQQKYPDSADKVRLITDLYNQVRYLKNPDQHKITQLKKEIRAFSLDNSSESL